MSHTLALGFVVASSAMLAVPTVAFAQFDTAEPNAAVVHPAIRCDECHEKMVKDWKTSAHARSQSSPMYRAELKGAGAEGCARCHAPLAATSAKDQPAAHEGITCIVCHTLKDVVPSPAGAKLEPQIQDTTMYGPLCDAKPHYFHKMGCSPLHEKAAFCGGCHLYYKETDGTKLPVYTEFEDWQKSDAKKLGADCQACHMPRTLGEVAKGGPKRDAVAHHGLWDTGKQLRKLGVSLSATIVASDAESVSLRLRLKNDGAGHAVPAGDPLHKIVLIAEAIDESKHVVDHNEHSYGRKLVNAIDVEVPFYQAVRLAEDTRLQPNEVKEEVIKLRAPLNGSLHLLVAFRAAAADTAIAIGTAAPEDIVIAESQVALRATRNGQRRKMPTTLKVN